MAQFATLAQPPLSPPGWVFPVVWTILYLLMGWASFLVWKSDAPQVEKKRALTLYGVQLAVNFAWPLLFFRAGLYGFALVWLVILLVLVAYWISLPLLVVGLFFGCKYRFSGPDLDKNRVGEVVNQVSAKVGDAVGQVRDEFKREFDKSRGKKGK